jgi:hypothetical protein
MQDVLEHLVGHLRDFALIPDPDICLVDYLVDNFLEVQRSWLLSDEEVEDLKKWLLNPENQQPLQDLAATTGRFKS